MVGDDLLFKCFFFPLSFFPLNKRFISVQERTGWVGAPGETPLPDRRLVHFRRVGQVVPVARPAVD